jgi:radical SAM protein with 4Fe4S-binding SPASM domain
MANISITSVCNKNCVYCFARDARDASAVQYMGDALFDSALDYLDRVKMKQVRLIGGEPTLHPKFIRLLEKSLERNLHPFLFTNGLMPPKVLDFLSSLAPGKMTILLNTVHPDEKNENNLRRQRSVMSKIGHFIIPGVNLYRPELSLDYLKKYFQVYDLKKEVRIGISHPVLSKNNKYLMPRQYRLIGSQIVAFKEDLDESGISITLDCGFVPCMFPIEKIPFMMKELKNVGKSCHPLLDLLSDGNFIPCYPLNDFIKVRFTDTVLANAIIDEMNLSLQLYRDIGIFPYCRSCPLFKTSCSGGCVAVRMNRFHHCKR